MSKQIEAALDLLHVHRAQLTKPAHLAAVDLIIKTLSPSKDAMRKREERGKAKDKTGTNLGHVQPTARTNGGHVHDSSEANHGQTSDMSALPVAPDQDSHSDSESFPLSNPSEPSSATSQAQQAAREVAGHTDPDELDDASEPYQPPGDSVFARPTATDEAIGWLERVTGVRWPKREWVREFEALAKKPIGEKRNAAIAMRADEWVKKNPHLANPGHVVKHWPKYASGNSRAVTVERDTGDALAERRLAARQLQDAETNARMAREMRGDYGPPKGGAA